MDRCQETSSCRYAVHGWLISGWRRESCPPSSRGALCGLGDDAVGNHWDPRGSRFAQGQLIFELLLPVGRLLRGPRIFSHFLSAIPPAFGTTVMKSQISSHSVWPGLDSVLCGLLSGLKSDFPQKQGRRSNLAASLDLASFSVTAVCGFLRQTIDEYGYTYLQVLFPEMFSMICTVSRPWWCQCLFIRCGGRRDGMPLLYGISL